MASGGKAVRRAERDVPVLRSDAVISALQRSWPTPENAQRERFAPTVALVTAVLLTSWMGYFDRLAEACLPYDLQGKLSRCDERGWRPRYGS